MYVYGIKGLICLHFDGRCLAALRRRTHRLFPERSYNNVTVRTMGFVSIDASLLRARSHRPARFRRTFHGHNCTLWTSTTLYVERGCL